MTPEPRLSFVSPSRVSQNREAVRAFVGAQDFWAAMADLQHRDLAPHLARLPAVRCSPEFVWLDSVRDSFAPAVSSLMGDTPVDEQSIVHPQARSGLVDNYRLSLGWFERVLPDTYQAYQDLVAFVIGARRPGYSGGTVSTRIGLIWLSPEETWSIELWVEHLLHEFVHNALFLEDMVHGVLTEGGARLDWPDAQALSAIRQVTRGYDKAYHSAFVSFALVEYYLRIGNPDRAYEFLVPLMPCLDELRRNVKFLTSHGRRLLRELIEAALGVWNASEGGHVEIRAAS